jgi:hypothetical protein
MVKEESMHVMNEEEYHVMLCVFHSPTSVLGDWNTQHITCTCMRVCSDVVGKSEETGKLN